jgi:hypothetical protein
MVGHDLYVCRLAKRSQDICVGHSPSGVRLCQVSIEKPAIGEKQNDLESLSGLCYLANLTSKTGLTIASRDRDRNVAV